MDKDQDAQRLGRIIGIIYEVIDDLNVEVEDINIVKKPDAVLLGAGSQLDSLMLVNLIVGTEQRIEEEFGYAISALANEKAMSLKSSPLRNIGTLAEFILGVLKDQELLKKTNNTQ